MAALPAVGRSVTRCQTMASASIGHDSIICGKAIIPRGSVDRVIFDRISRRGGDGLDAYLTGNAWPLEWESPAGGLEPGGYLFISWHDEGGPNSVAFPLTPAEQGSVVSQVRKAGYSFFDAVQDRTELRQRIAHARVGEHVRRYLDKPFRIAGFHLSAGTYEFTLLENTEGLDLLCVEDQAMIAHRRWWLISAHVLPTDDKRSQGTIVYENPAAAELSVAEIRFPLKKALPIE